MSARSCISEVQFNPLTEESNKISEGFKERILHYMYVNNGSDLILPENFLSEAGLSLLPHLSILLEGYTSAKYFLKMIEYVVQTNLKKWI